MLNVSKVEKSQYKDWVGNLIAAWLVKGISAVATNKNPRPLSNGHYSRRSEQNKWDEENEQALGILLERFDRDLRKQSGPLQSYKCFKVFNYLQETYGGAHDVDTLVMYIKKAAKDLTEKD